jgi:hypothetical protein
VGSLAETVYEDCHTGLEPGCADIDENYHINGRTGSIYEGNPNPEEVKIEKPPKERGPDISGSQ